MKLKSNILVSALLAALMLPASLLAADATEYKLELAKAKATLRDAREQGSVVEHVRNFIGRR